MLTAAGSGGQDRLELHLRITAKVIVWLQANLDLAAALGDSGLLVVVSHSQSGKGECPCV